MTNSHKFSKNQLTQHLLNNKVVAINTDTVWGLLSLNEFEIIRVKGKGRENKKTVRFIHSISQIPGDIPSDLLELTKKYWPGSLTIIFKEIGYRIPNSKTILQSLKELNIPIYASSANLTNNKTAKSMDEVKKFFSNDKNIVFMHTNEKNLGEQASTVYNYDTKQIIRKGEIGIELIEKFVKKI